MTIPQRVIKQRRQYNQWVGNQTLEDFALRFTAAKARRRAFAVGSTALGAVSFLACEAIGGSLTLTFGFANTMAAIGAAGLIMFLVGLPICLAAIRHGVDVDLLTRGAGFGYLGSTVTSLIYATFTFVLFSIEASIMSAALVMALHIPLWLANFCSVLAAVPIATLGIRVISRMQMLTQPVWLILQFGPLCYLAWRGLPDFTAWTRFTGALNTPGLAVLPFGTATSILLSLLPQIGEQVDYLRFLPATRNGRTLGAMLLAGPGWVLTGCAKLAAGSFLAYLAISRGVPWNLAPQPATMFRIAYFEAFHNGALASALMLIFVVVCQIKINTTNAYAGSIAWSNFFSRLTHSHPGRVVWVLFNGALALLLMQLGIYRIIQNILGLYADLAVGWMGALAADLVVNKRLGLSPSGIEFQRAHLYDLNPVGIGAMAVSVLFSTLMSFGAFGGTARSLATLAGLALAFLAAPVIAWATGGRYYLARAPEPARETRCVVCETVFEAADIAACPAYGGAICSLCCTLEARCRDLCKPHGRLGAQALHALPVRLAAWVRRQSGSRLLPFLSALAVSSLILAGTLGLIGLESASLEPAMTAAIWNTLEIVFVALFIMAALASWFFVLAQASRRAAEAETRHQTAMLLDEIAAHERTDAALQKAKSAAESANIAKSRYIVGVIHEIRAPLNAIFGYAQMLEAGDAPRPEEAVRTIRRSTAHLSNLVDGLLDISQIETGALHLHRDPVPLHAFLDQLADMFRLEASAKGIAFSSERAGNLPRFVFTDEKRLRQVLINLLSNAVKYTSQGHVRMAVHKRGEVTQFSVSDTGCGIRPEDLDRIFEPFERGHLAAATALPGTGLGLTICKLLTEILGGEITVRSVLGQGSTFRVRLLLPEAPAVQPRAPARRIRAYLGPQRKILIADDDQDHIRLVRDVLQPLGFVTFAVSDGPSCLVLHDEIMPDLVLLDISMPGMSGLEVAASLRRANSAARILMVSGNLHEAARQTKDGYDGFLAKPINLRALLERIGHTLGLEWVHDTAAPKERAEITPPAAVKLAELRRLAQIGYVRGIEAQLAALEQSDPAYAPFCAEIADLLRDFAMPRLIARLDAMVPPQ